MAKTIITHINPDLDAVAAVWLILRFLPGWEGANIDYCKSNLQELAGKVDTDPDVLYTDVGRGKLDHHQMNKITSAAEKTYRYVLKARKNQPFNKLESKTLKEMVEVLTEIDNAREIKWPEISEGRSDSYLHTLVAGIRGITASDKEAMDFGLKGMNAWFHMAKKRINALEELKKGIEFESLWGKAIAVETGNDSVLFEGEKLGYAFVIRKDTETGGVRIYARWDKGVDLTNGYKKVTKMDPNSDWYLHQSKCLLLNMAKMSKLRPTKLTLKQLIDIFKTKR